ncbi:MAG: bile acid:sodium symporter [Deltaproteobacteria bacterium]|nr:bile acid:sodium symporter [Deltaproteobacteria bacterium]
MKFALACTFLMLLIPVPKSHAQIAPAKDTVAPKTVGSEVLTGKELYERLSDLVRTEGANLGLFSILSEASHQIDFARGEKISFLGNLRFLEVTGQKDGFYLVRARTGEVYVLALPKNKKALEKGAESPYADLGGKLKNKMMFQAKKASQVIGGTQYDFVQLIKAPERTTLDRLFFIAIVLLLFLTMVGMGLTLTLSDFGLVFKKPLGMIIGLLCQFGLLPLVAMLLGRAFGFYEAYPFIFLGMILIASSPGGVTSNLMTYLGKGDVALSVSLTALCTVLSIVFTPMLLTLYVANIPDFTIPVMEVMKTMLVLVVVPLFVGMLIRSYLPKFAKKAEKPFALLGVFALLFLIIVGVWSNLDQFADTARYGFGFYTVVFLLTFAGMFLGAVIAKLARVNNFQTRAISLEVGLRNASLAMTIAILLQDRIGDFSSSMFFTSGIFGLWMYVAGAISIFAFKRLLPVKEATS